jgi:hypothetical protein
MLGFLRGPIVSRRPCPSGLLSPIVLLLSLVPGTLWPASVLAQTDEIQVYDGGMAARGVFNLALHNNYVARGLETPAFEGGVTADRSWNGAPEWALGIRSWFEAGLYLPLYSLDRHLGWGLNGFKLRTLFATPNADTRRFVYGVNLELSFNARRWDPTRLTSEVRPVLGWHLRHFDLVLNPILDTAYDGLKNVDFAPCARLAFNFRSSWAVALEEYADLGPVSGFRAPSDQSHELYFVLDHQGGLDVEAGVGVGLTSASNALTFKLILSRDLNRRKAASGPGMGRP